MTPAPDAVDTGVPPKFSRAVVVALGLIPINFGVWIAMLSAPRRASEPLTVAFTAVALTQLVAGVVAFVQGVRFVRRSKEDKRFGETKRRVRALLDDSLSPWGEGRGEGKRGATSAATTPAARG